MRKLLLGVALARAGRVRHVRLVGRPAAGRSARAIPAPATRRRRSRSTGRSCIACSNGQQIVVDIEGNNARVQIVGGPSMVLPGDGGGHYTNGRYGFRGGGASGQWEVGRAAPADCTGS